MVFLGNGGHATTPRERAPAHSSELFTDSVDDVFAHHGAPPHGTHELKSWCPGNQAEHRTSVREHLEDSPAIRNRRVDP